jgi:hypothetical protein
MQALVVEEAPKEVVEAKGYDFEIILKLTYQSICYLCQTLPKIAYWDRCLLATSAM